MKRPIPLWPVTVTVLLAMLRPVDVRAQGRDDLWEAPEWVGEITFLGANALLGAVTAGILQEIRGGSFQEGFTRGAFGGTLSYGGRRLAVEDFWGAGLIGRQVSAVGASVVRNASERRPVFSRLLVPAGPLLVYVRRDNRWSFSVRGDVYSTAWLLTAVIDDRLDVDWSASLSAGAPVFHAPGHRMNGSDGELIDGKTVGGVIVLGRGAGNLSGHDVLAHERVHVLQRDFGREVWGGPLETWLAGFVPGGKTVVRFVEPGIAHSWIRGSLVDLLDLEWGDRPWEIEAEFLEHR